MGSPVVAKTRYQRIDTDLRDLPSPFCADLTFPGGGLSEAIALNEYGDTVFSGLLCGTEDHFVLATPKFPGFHVSQDDFHLAAPLRGVTNFFPQLAAGGAVVVRGGRTDTAHLVVKVGDSIAGLAGPIRSLALDDPVNANGQLAFRAGTATESAIVRASPTGGTLDLSGWADLVEDDTPVLPGNPKTATVTVMNAGTSLTSPPFRVEVFLSTDETLDPSDPKVGEISSFTLDPSTFTKRPVDILLTAPNLPGFDHAGRRYLIARVDPDGQLREATKDNNTRAGLAFWMGEVLTVVTHGFNPRPESLLKGGQPWPEFRATGVKIADRFRAMPTGSGFLYRRVSTHVSEWNSSDDGFWDAFVDTFVACVAEAESVLASRRGDILGSATAAKAAKLLNQLAYVSGRSSRLGAMNSAVNLINTIRGRGLLMEDSDLSRRFQHLHLIGHSRGGALNARLSLLLEGLGYRVDEYTALDGFSEDWPYAGPLFGDVSITENTRADAKTNYRVSQDLAVAVARMVSGNGLSDEGVRIALQAVIRLRTGREVSLHRLGDPGNAG